MKRKEEGAPHVSPRMALAARSTESGRCCCTRQWKVANVRASGAEPSGGLAFLGDASSKGQALRREHPEPQDRERPCGWMGRGQQERGLRKSKGEAHQVGVQATVKA